MISLLSYPVDKKLLTQKFREKRFQHFRSLLDSIGNGKKLKVLDIGGTQKYWENMQFGMKNEAEITLLNLKTIPSSYPNFKSIAGNACDLSKFEDKCFDVVFSNSVIEHLFTKQAQKQMASEVQRVGKNYYIQTPNLYFPVEPHWIFPFFQFLPFDLKVALTLNFDLGHYKKAANKEAAIQRVKEVRLLSEKEMKSLFADGEIYRERIGGLTKSITLYKFSKT